MLAQGAVDVRVQAALVGVGAVISEVVAAAGVLEESGHPVDVVCLSSPDLVFRALQARRGLREGDDWILDEIFPVDRAAPIVSVLDGHPHTLAFLGTVRQQPITITADATATADVGYPPKEAAK